MYVAPDAALLHAADLVLMKLTGTFSCISTWSHSITLLSINYHNKITDAAIRDSKRICTATLHLTIDLILPAASDEFLMNCNAAQFMSSLTLLP